ncbi:MAG: hypothetical protein JSW06_01890 [Thermoplasmatales archaeon]|nr:MAG: hypothetical protein JSW06_01890 [Thermoplasmatales archaeon]
MDKIERGDLVVIYWWDIEDDSTWKPIEVAEIEQLPLCKTVGWFLNQDDNCVRLAFSVNGTEDTKLEVGRTLIPKAVIKNIEKVREDELGAE